MPKTKAKLQLDEGLILPLGAGAGKILTSDGSGNGSWVAALANAWYTTAAGTAVGGATAGGAYLLMPLAASFGQAGDAGAFTRNADGSITVRDAGVYTFSANVVWGGVTGSRRRVLIVAGTATSDPALSIDERDSATTGGVTSSTAFNGFLAAAQVVSCFGFTDSANCSRYVATFGIARVA